MYTINIAVNLFLQEKTEVSCFQHSSFYKDLNSKYLALRKALHFCTVIRMKMFFSNIFKMVKDILKASKDFDSA